MVDYLLSFEDKERAAKGLKYVRPDELDRNDMQQVLANNLSCVLHIEKLITRELIDLDVIEKTEEEVISELRDIKSVPMNFDNPADEVTVPKLFRKLKQILILELQTIQLIKKNPAKAMEYQKTGYTNAPDTTFLFLFKLIVHKESGIAEALHADYPDSPFTDAQRKKLKAIITDFLAGKPTGVPKKQAKISRDAIDTARDLAERRDGPILSDIINDDKALTDRILSEYPKLSPAKVKEIIIALRENLYEPE